MFDNVPFMSYIEYMEKEILTIKQVMGVLNVSKTTVYDLVNRESDPLPVIYLSERTPRVIKSDLYDWLERQPKGGDQ